MKTRFLFPNAFKKPSLIVFVLTTISMIIISNLNDYLNLQLNVKTFAFLSNQAFKEPLYFRWFEDDIFPELLGIILILSGLIFAFSKEKTEDEMISKIRTESLVWATYINYAVLLFCIIFIYGFAFFNVMIYNMFTLLFIFIVRFHWMLYKNNQICNHEE